MGLLTPAKFGLMSRSKGSNKLIVAKKIYLAGTYWREGKSISWIAYKLGVSERQVYYYLNKWLYNRREVQDIIERFS